MADAPAALLAASVAMLSPGRAEWGRAMVGELDQLSSRSERWRFALSCLRAVLFAPRSPRAGRLIVTAMATAAIACVGLVGYGLVRYPGLVAGGGTWVAVAIFLGVLGAYTLTTSVIVRRLDPASLASVRVALWGAVTIGALWILVGAGAQFGAADYVGTLLTIAVPLASVFVGLAATWVGRSVRTGRLAALLSALGSGLLVFLVWVGDTLLTGGRPYDTGMVRDFHSTGTDDLATYAVSDNLGAAMVLLLLVPMLAAAFGLAGTAIAARRIRAAGDR